LADLHDKATAFFSVGYLAPEFAKALDCAVAEHPLPCPIRGEVFMVFAAGHPIQDETGAQAAMTVEPQQASTIAKDRVIALISGGGSAILPALTSAIALADKAAVNSHLLSAGPDITQMNLIRQSRSRLKGVRLMRLAAPTPLTSYILSDAIGSGLTVPSRTFALTNAVCHSSSHGLRCAS